MRARWGFALLAGLLVVLLGVLVAVGAGRDTRRDVAAAPAPEAVPTPDVRPAASGAWVGTWTGAPSGAEPGTRDGLPGRSLRNVMTASVGGSRARVELSNEYGTRPVTFTEVTVALAAGRGPAALPGTLRGLTFDGEGAVTVPVGATVLSDPVDLEVPAGAGLLVSVYAPEPSGPVTYHRMARQTGYSAAGEAAGDEGGAAYTRTTEHWRYVTGVQVFTPYTDGAVVVLGDSLTDGVTSTPDADHRWTDFLAARLREEPGAPRMAVLNQGISGNRLLRDAPFDRLFYGVSGERRLTADVLREEGARTLVVQLGINDLILDPHETDADAVVAGLTRLADEARAAGLHVAGATLTPFDWNRAESVRLERVRQQVNARIRAGEVFDVVLDFDRALRDPNRPHRLLPRYDSGDGLHPSDEGFRAMSAAVDLSRLAHGADRTL
ncbi:SGNH/GDSL hydrolase family protein [Streptomyces avicenniae]|uniref:SGNH/GDSL hydrolase family protein n=1 Tax=Streptomyces avicenniae TaxID=500153 RepID=UPI000DA603F4|nr:SGNH/GDSL hydrolase family protein [Streptomyces avicenniae]